MGSHRMTNRESVADDKSTPEASSPQTAGSRVEISSDDDWKNRVKAEDAALDQRFRSDPGAGKEAGRESHASTEPPQAAQASESPAAATSARDRATAREMPNPTFGD